MFDHVQPLRELCVELVKLRNPLSEIFVLLLEPLHLHLGDGLLQKLTVFFLEHRLVFGLLLELFLEALVTQFFLSETLLVSGPVIPQSHDFVTVGVDDLGVVLLEATATVDSCQQFCNVLLHVSCKLYDFCVLSPGGFGLWLVGSVLSTVGGGIDIVEAVASPGVIHNKFKNK